MFFFFFFDCVLYSHNVLLYFNAFNAVLCVTKIFKYLAVSPTLGMLNNVVHESLNDILVFLLMMAIIMFAFCMAFYMAFSNSNSTLSVLFWRLLINQNTSNAFVSIC